MGQVFVVEDDFHAAWMGRFTTRRAALEFLDGLRSDPLAEVHRPPCGNPRCRRQYWLREFDDSGKPWREVASEPAFEVSSGQVGQLTAK